MLQDRSLLRTQASVTPTHERPVAFMFPGQGTQYVNMALGLYLQARPFKTNVDRCAELLRPLLGIDLRDLLFPVDDCSETAGRQLDETWILSPCCS